MNAQDTLRRLDQALTDLDDALGELAITLGDVPDDEPAVVESVRHRVDDVRGDLRDGSAALRHSGSRGLAACHAAFNDAARRIRGEIVSAANVLETAAIAAERGGAWQKWSRTAREGFDRVSVATDAVGDALLACWRDLVA